MTTSKRRRKGPSCPVCGKASAAKAEGAGTSPYPFCSARCRSVDLGNWLGEHYRLEDDLGAPVPVTGNQD